MFKAIGFDIEGGWGREAAKLAFIDLVLRHDAHSEGVVLMKSPVVGVGIGQSDCWVQLQLSLTVSIFSLSVCGIRI